MPEMYCMSVKHYGEHVIPYGGRFSVLAFSYIRFAVQIFSNKNTGGQVWADPAENCRRVSERPGEPAGMRVQGAFCRDATSRPAR